MESWYANGWGTSYANYISPSSLHSIGRFERNDRGCRRVNVSLRERRRLKPARPFLWWCYFLWCDRYFASGGLSDLAGVTMPIPSLLMTLSFTSGPISIVVKVLLTLLIRVNTLYPEVSHTPYIRLAVLLTFFSSMGEKCPGLIGSSPFLSVPFYL